MITIQRATPDDAKALHAIQMRAFAEEGRLCGMTDIPPLTEPLDDIERHIRTQTALAAREGDRIVGGVRGLVEGDACTIRALVVEPDRQGQGIGKSLLAALEAAIPPVRRIDLTTNTIVPGNVAFYERHGYLVVGHTRYTDRIVLAHMSKNVGSADPFDLGRFLDAQAANYADALAELRAGRKRTHWSWYVFPQLRGLGSSAMSVRYAISGLEEARAYLAHPVLGPRLRDCVGAMNAHAGIDAAAILGEVDAMKFHACVTLFARVAGPGSPFHAALDRHFAGTPNPATLALLAERRAG